MLAPIPTRIGAPLVPPTIMSPKAVIGFVILALNVDQSVDVRNPPLLEVACEIETVEPMSERGEENE